jgi:predicted CXXCH cytochrome family protein
MKSLLPACVLAVMLAAPALAVVTGECVNCHTMHNSQDGSSMRFDDDSDPAEMLLKTAACGGCHADVSFGEMGFPQVALSDRPLAGGSFYWVMQGDDAKGHNVKDLNIAVDRALDTYPPGYDPSQDVFSNIDWNQDQLTCAGTVGCHGDRTKSSPFLAVKGAHHANSQVDSRRLTEPAYAYRFLVGIYGYEDSDWEKTKGPNDHNYYAGYPRSGGLTTGRPDTISAFCGQCHGQYHMVEGIAQEDSFQSPWLRHPTDIDMRELGDDTEYAAYTYSTDVPVATSYYFAAGVDDTVYDESAIVMCLSCHRAHGSPYDDLLRWEYSTMEAAKGHNPYGCFACHTTKDN